MTSTLLSRAADVMLKERRRLVLLLRETPYHLGHLRAMTAATEAGDRHAAGAAFYSTAIVQDIVTVPLVVRWICSESRMILSGDGKQTALNIKPDQ